MPTGTTLFRNILFSWLWVMCFWGMAQVPLENLNETNYQNLNPYLKVFVEPDSLTAEEALFRIRTKKLKRSNALSSPGFSKDYFWLNFDLTAPISGQFVLEVNNPHIDHIALFQVKNENLLLIGRGGDHEIFDLRKQYNRRYIFNIDLESQERQEYLMLIDKRNASVSFPMRIWTQRGFIRAEQKLDFWHGIYFGVLLFISGLSLGLAFFLKERHFFSYSVYVAVVGLYVFTQLGYSFQFLYPNSSFLNNYARIVLGFGLLLTSADFFRRILDVKKYLPALDKGFLFLSIGMLGVLSFWLFNRMFNPNYAIYTIATLNILYGAVLLFFASVLYTSISTWKLQRQTIVLILSAFVALMIGATIYILIEYGVLPEYWFPVNPILIGSVIEILILSTSMIQRVKKMDDHKKELADSLLMQQKELMNAYIRGGEEENDRISKELHDDIGCALSLLKSKISDQDMDKENIKINIDTICENVRVLSHRLQPQQLDLMDLQEIVEAFCHRFQKDTGVKVELTMYSVPTFSKSKSIVLFRVLQESLQNILKHAKAKGIEVQIVGYEHELVMTIDDNGQGFDTSKIYSGLGILNMKARANAVNGSFELASYIGKGTNLVLSIPI